MYSLITSEGSITTFVYFFDAWLAAQDLKCFSTICGMGEDWTINPPIVN